MNMLAKTPQSSSLVWRGRSLGGPRSFQPADAPWIENHRGHLMVVKDEERPFITPELIRRTTFTGTADALLPRIAALRDAGYTQFTIQLTPGQESAIEDWAAIMRAFK